MEARTARRPLSSLDRRTHAVRARVLHAVSCCGGAPTKSRAHCSSRRLIDDARSVHNCSRAHASEVRRWWASVALFAVPFVVRTILLFKCTRTQIWIRARASRSFDRSWRKAAARFHSSTVSVHYRSLVYVCLIRGRDSGSVVFWNTEEFIGVRIFLVRSIE